MRWTQQLIHHLITEDTTEAAIKIFDEVAQAFKEMSEPLLQTPLDLQEEPQELNGVGLEDEMPIDAVPIEDAEETHLDILPFAP